MRFRGSFPGNSHNSFRHYGIYILSRDREALEPKIDVINEVILPRNASDCIKSIHAYLHGHITPSI